MLNYPSLILSFSRRYRCKTGQIGTTQSLRQSRSRAIPTRFDDAGQGNADHLREQGYDVDIWSYDRPVSRDGIAIVPD